MLEQPPKYPSAYRSELQAAYEVCYKTMRKWLRSVPDVKTKYVHHFTPKEVALIIAFLGEPKNDLKN